VKNNESRIELFNNLFNFCNFPKKITYPHIIKEAKYPYEFNYSKSISLINILNQMKLKHGYHSKINIIYINSSSFVEDKHSFSCLLNEVNKSKLSNISVFMLDDFPTNEASDDNIFLLINVTCFSKKYSDLFCYFTRKLNNTKSSIYVYQMFLKYFIHLDLGTL
jgi:hypothetical protein